MGGVMDKPDPAEEAAGRMIEYYRELEMLIALLLVKYGERHDGGFRYHIDDEEAWRLRRELGTLEPVVIQTHELQDARYTINVL